MIDFYEILNKRFGILPPTKYDQDWQWTCGDTSQTEDYISFYQEFYDSMLDDQKDVIINMIIQGFDDKLCQTSDVTHHDIKKLWNKIENILITNYKVHANTIRYWASLNVSLDDAFCVAKYMRKLVKGLNLEWNEVRTDSDVEFLNEIYENFEDSLIVSINYISGDSVDDSLVGNMKQDNNLKILFQRLDKSPFSIELWFTHTKQIRFLFSNPSDNCMSDIMKAKVCQNEKSVFWTTWIDFDPNNIEQLSYSDVVLIEAEGLRWRYITE